MAAINLALLGGRPTAEVVADFVALAQQILGAWPAAAVRARPFARWLYEELPINLTKHIAVLLTRLRAL